MILNDLEQPLLCIFSPNLIALLANYVTVVEDTPVMSAKYRLPVQSSTFSQN